MSEPLRIGILGAARIAELSIVQPLLRRRDTTISSPRTSGRRRRCPTT
jgi:hypothetical protein